FPEAAQRELIAKGGLPLQGVDLGCRVIASAAERQERRRHAGTIAPLALRPLRAGTDLPLTEWEAKQILSRHGVTVPAGVVAHPARAAETAAGLHHPLVLKASSRALPHKTEAGGVALGLTSRDEIAAAADRVLRQVAAHDPALAIEELLIEEMVDDAV